MAMARPPRLEKACTLRTLWLLLISTLSVAPVTAFIPPSVPSGPSRRCSVTMASTATSRDKVLSPLLDAVEVSKTIEIHALTKAMEARGEAVVSLCVGEPDFPPPKEVVEATCAAVREGHTRYTAVTGDAELRKAICKDLQRRKGVTYKPEQVVVGNGAKQEVYQGVLALCRPGDEVIIPAPYWPSYPEIVKLAGATPVIVETTADNGYLLDPEDLSKAITPKTRMLIFCNPSNPTGAVHPPALVDAIADVLKRSHASHVWVMSDEIYERIVYDTPHKCMAAMEGMLDRTLVINGFSKAYGMTGFRLGYIAAPPAVIKGVTTLQSQITSCANSIAQRAGIVALGLPDEVMAPSIAEMKEKRDQVMAALQGILGVQCTTPEGAFYVLPDVSAYFNKRTPDGQLIKDSHELCMYFLEQHKVALVPGDSFGAPSTVRISYATSKSELHTALDRLKECLTSLA